MNLEELVREVAEKHRDIPVGKLDEVFLDAVQAIEDALVAGSKVKLHRTLTLEPKVLKAKRAYNGLTKTYFDKEPSKTVRVRVHKRLADRLSGEGN